MKGSVLYFFLLVLGVSLNLTLDIIYKCSRFSEVFSEKNLKLVLCGGDGLVTFDPCLMLLPTKVNPIPEKISYKRDVIMTLDLSNFEMVLALLTKTFHVQVF